MALTLGYLGPSLRDGNRDLIAVIASRGETRLRDITQSECHLAGGGRKSRLDG